MIACTTVIGRGLPGRGRHPGRAQREAHAEITGAARRALEWPDAPFVIPADIAQALARRRPPQRTRIRCLADAHRGPAGGPSAHCSNGSASGALPDGWQDALHAYAKRSVGEAKSGIMISGRDRRPARDAIPELLSGAPDLEGATQHKRSLRSFTPADRTGRYIHYGIREHAMGAMLNGMAAHGGVVPVGVTYLVFADYMRPTLRLAAMMGLPVPFVFSHNSIGVGTQRPDASAGRVPRRAARHPEHARAAAGRRGGSGGVLGGRARPPRRAVLADLRPPGLAARRGKTLPRARPRAAPMCWPRRTASAQATLLATGSEVAVALQARAACCKREGVPTAVVSMPSWELFEQQGDDYRRAGARVRPRAWGRGGRPPRLGPLYRTGRRLRRHEQFGASGPE